jgi:hypothetical protein
LNRLRIKIFLKIFLFYTVFYVFSQNKNEDYVNENFLRYDDHVYKTGIKTVLCHESSFEMNPPMIELNSGQKIEVSFDDLEGGFKTFQYTFIHCDASWNPDDLMVSEYLSGFFDDQINTRNSSFNTTIQYTHYKFQFPNNSIQFTKSGNYLLLVYENGNKEDLIITRKIIVFESLVNISARVHTPLGSEKLYNSHEVDFSVFHKNYQINNPYLDLKIVITQNQRWDNAISGLKPVFVKENELVYDFDDGSNCFDAINEFRSTDVKSYKYPGPNTLNIFRDSSTKQFQIIQKNDEQRTFKKYLNIQDINGRMLIKCNECNNSETESDYMKVHFYLPFDLPPDNGDVYILGSLSKFKFSKENKMVYNPKFKRYEGNMDLKQGYYNYLYGFLRDGDQIPDLTYFEGNLGQTENDYTVLIYHRANGTYYDRLISVSNLNSVRN